MLYWTTWTVTVLSLLELAFATPTLHGRRREGSVSGVFDERTGEELPLEEIARRFTRRTEGGIHLPIVRSQAVEGVQRRAGADSGVIGLGDYVDVAYSVLITIDTGSSDLWVMSDACTTGCGRNVPLYPQATFESENLEARLFYGDSTSGTSAFGMIGRDRVDLAGITLTEQYFAAINRTNTSIARTGSAGIFGLGFPVNSVIWSQLFTRELGGQAPPTKRDFITDEPQLIPHHDVKYGTHYFPNLHGFPSRFPSLGGVLTTAGVHPAKRQISQGMINLLNSFTRLAPFLPRLVADSDIAMPLFTVSLQRNTVDVGGNLGQLTIGEMPSGVSVDDLTWVPVRNYSYEEGGLPAPPNSPNEEYPIAWEVLIDDVYLDGVKLPRSNITVASATPIALSALVDTGNSLIRGPEDVVDHIYRELSGGSPNGRFRCNEPHTLAFSIGGKMFPVDPRDFATQVFLDDVSVCAPNLVPTDPPQPGGYLFGWSLGAPFLKGVLSAYHFGNLTYPSQDPPRMGFRSTVPTNAGELLQAAVTSASRFDNFPMLSAPAPTGTAAASVVVSATRPGATTTDGSSPSNAATSISGVWTYTALAVVVSVSFLLQS
ncbi:hypothetical protein NMY22_g9912 [Coprinellus aureogranulatus]|nr:hypothetical protein NMY22_g9912 [Coprinellus aureogranulatus]